MGGVAPAHYAVDVGACLSERRPSISPKGGDVSDVEQLIPVTVPEVRRLLCRLLWSHAPTAEHTLRWSRWRRWKQRRVQISHDKRRGINLELR